MKACGRRRTGRAHTLPVRVWHHSTVARILCNAVYVGTLHYGKKTRLPGKQNPEKWTPNGGGISNSEHKEITEHLESSVNGGAFEPSGQSLTVVQSTAGKVKIELRQCEKTISCPN